MIRPTSLLKSLKGKKSDKEYILKIFAGIYMIVETCWQSDVIYVLFFPHFHAISLILTF